MDLPEDFPADARARIEAAEIRGAIEISSKTTTILGEAVPDLIDYIMSVVLAFGLEACKRAHIDRLLPSIGRESWTIARAESETRGFLRQFATHVFEEYGVRNGVMPDRSIDVKLWKQFLRSSQWISFQKERLAEAELRMRPTGFTSPFTIDSVIPTVVPFIKPPKSPTALDIERFRKEARITQEELAAETGFDASTVYRHESGDATPQPWRISTYERVFSKLLNRNILICETPIKRK